MPLLCPFVGTYIHRAIVERQFTVGETALRLGVSRSYFYRILSGGAGVSARLAIALEYVLKIRGDILLHAAADRGLERARVKELRRIVKLSAASRARPCHADVLALCQRGSQWCHVCRDWTCGDNDNPEKPVKREKPKPLRLRAPRGKQLSLDVETG